MKIVALKERAESGEIPIEGARNYTIKLINSKRSSPKKKRLKTILPIAFAIVKDTTRRFFENSKSLLPMFPILIVNLLPQGFCH